MMTVPFPTSVQSSSWIIPPQIFSTIASGSEMCSKPSLSPASSGQLERLAVLSASWRWAWPPSASQYHQPWFRELICQFSRVVIWAPGRPPLLFCTIYSMFTEDEVPFRLNTAPLSEDRNWASLYDNISSAAQAGALSIPETSSRLEGHDWDVLPECSINPQLIKSLISWHIHRISKPRNTCSEPSSLRVRTVSPYPGSSSKLTSMKTVWRFSCVFFLIRLICDDPMSCILSWLSNPPGFLRFPSFRQWNQASRFPSECVCVKCVWNLLY